MPPRLHGGGWRRGGQSGNPGAYSDTRKRFSPRLSFTLVLVLSLRPFPAVFISREAVRKPGTYLYTRTLLSLSQAAG